MRAFVMNPKGRKKEERRKWKEERTTDTTVVLCLYRWRYAASVVFCQPIKSFNLTISSHPFENFYQNRWFIFISTIIRVTGSNYFDPTDIYQYLFIFCVHPDIRQEAFIWYNIKIIQLKTVFFSSSQKIYYQWKTCDRKKSIILFLLLSRNLIPLSNIAHIQGSWERERKRIGCENNSKRIKHEHFFLTI